MSNNNTKRRKAKKALSKNLYPHQVEALKDMIGVGAQDLTAGRLPTIGLSMSLQHHQGKAYRELRDIALRHSVHIDRKTIPRIEDAIERLAMRETGSLTIRSLKTRSDAGGLRLNFDAKNVTFSNEAWGAMETRAQATVAQGPTERDDNGYPVWPDWLILKNGRHPQAGEYGGLCYRTVCQRPNAVWWNRGSYHYYCEDCARMLNRENRRSWRELQQSYAPENRKEGEMCIELGPDDEHPVPLG